jgi:hypothetical protein
MWVVFHGKASAMINAITGNSGFDSSLNNALGNLNLGSNSSSSSSSSSSKVTGNQPDSGTHMGIDSDGNIVTINKDYGSMSDSEKDAANNFAHQIGNV